MSLPDQGVPQNRASAGSVSAALAAARAETQAILNAGVKVPREEGGHSLAEMAQRDLDAALQLLADRAQYITGATGAAIALRRSGKNDMLCRASTGSNAPELGALLSTEFGLSGESVRTRQLLRCDDAERDARVNRDVCRRLGIASVVVMPVVNDDEVLGVFELFSGTANAFGERDFSAVQRLSEMVETAVRLAEATQSLPERLGIEKPVQKVQTGKPEPEILDRDLHNNEDHPFAEGIKPAAPIAASEVVAENATAAVESGQNAEKAKAGKPGAGPPAAAEAKPVFWSATQNSSIDEAKPSPADESHLPPVLRNLHKCAACGFPVSAGRMLCVECEEKKWRGQLRSKTAVPITAISSAANAIPKGEAHAVAAAASSGATAAAVPPMPIELSSNELSSKEVSAAGSRLTTTPLSVLPKGRSAPVAATKQVEPPRATASAPVFSAALEPSQSWFSRNKYILGALVLVAAVVSAIYFLR